MKPARTNVADLAFFPPTLLAIYISTSKLRQGVAEMAEQTRWVLFASIVNSIATGLLVIVFVLEL